MLQNEKCRVELYVDKKYLFPNNKTLCVTRKMKKGGE